MNLKEAERIRDVVTAALADAFEQVKNGKDDFGAVNWGDLGCIDVEQRVSLLFPSNPAEVYAIVSEASEGAHGLCRFVEEHLKKNGLPGVSVVCEW